MCDTFLDVLFFSLDFQRRNNCCGSFYSLANFVFTKETREYVTFIREDMVHTRIREVRGGNEGVAFLDIRVFSHIHTLLELQDFALMNLSCNQVLMPSPRPEPYFLHTVCFSNDHLILKMALIRIVDLARIV